MLRRGVWAAVICLAGSGAAWGDAGISFNGTTVGGPVMAVPNSTTTLSGRIGRYSIQPFFPAPDVTPTTCDIFGVQDGLGVDGGEADAVLLLYMNGFDPTAPLDNLIAYNDDVAGDTGVSRIENVVLDFSNDYYLVTQSYDVGAASPFSNHIQCLDGFQRIIAGDGLQFLGNSNNQAYDGRVTEVQNGRFQISATWEDFAHVTGAARAVPMAANDSALLYFFEPQNWELLVKVINGCGSNNRFWVFMAATTNVKFNLTIRDTKNTRFDPSDDSFYFVNNALGSTANIVRQDINAFVCP